jgi:protein arginine N-methyltransferase 7
VVADPFFQSSVLPWHNLHFWYAVKELKACFSPNVSFVPKTGILKGIVVKYKDLWKIRAPVGRVCNGDFDLVDFDNLILVRIWTALA